MIIWGFRTSVLQLAVLLGICQTCGQQCAQTYRRRTRKFTLFFIPLFSVSKRYYRQCAACGANVEVASQEADWAMTQASPTGKPQSPYQQPGY